MSYWPFEAQWLLYVPPSLTLKSWMYCPQNRFITFVWFSEWTAIIFLCSISQIFFVKEVHCVFPCGRNWIHKCYLVELQAKLNHSNVFKHPIALIYSSQTVLFPSTMQLVYFFLLLFTFITCFGCKWTSSGVLLPKSGSLCGESHFYYHIWMRYALISNNRLLESIKINEV
jgi:hypothetical protein